MMMIHSVYQVINHQTELVFTPTTREKMNILKGITMRMMRIGATEMLVMIMGMRKSITVIIVLTWVQIKTGVMTVITITSLIIINQDKTQEGINFPTFTKTGVKILWVEHKEDLMGEDNLEVKKLMLQDEGPQFQCKESMVGLDHLHLRTNHLLYHHLQ